MHKPPSLERRLLAWACGTLLAVWCVFLGAGYATGLHESEELADGQLASAAALVLSQDEPRFAAPAAVASTPAGAHADMRAHDYQQSLSVFIWNAAGELLTRHGSAPAPAFSPDAGFTDLMLGEPALPWRAYAQWDTTRSRKVMVALSHAERRELAHDIAGQVAEPAVWLIPAVLVVLAMAIRRGLVSLRDLSQRVASLDVAHGQKLGPSQNLAELKAIEQAIDALVDGQTARLVREKRLADELAHELRSPLAAIALQARALQGDMPATDRQRLLEQIAADAQRSGVVLGQVLELARAHRAALSEAAERFEVQPLLARAVDAFLRRDPGVAPRLQLQGGVSLAATGHPVLLEQAVHNLVENGLVHGPAGAQVRVQALENAAGQTCIRVSTQPTAAGPNGGEPGTTGHQPARLGLGLQIAARIAELHGGSLRRVDDPGAQTPGAQIWEIVLGLPGPVG